MRTTFAVGRLTSSAAEIVLLEDEPRPSFPGPWTLRAVVRDPADDPTSGKASRGRVRRERAPARDRTHGGPGNETVH